MEFRTDQLLHGGDYNPEQWLKRPDILAKDLDMLEESGCNVVSLGIFSWSTLEPEEGVFHFEWLKEIIDKLYQRGISTILATPSGARPKWMADKYPEVLRVDETGHRNHFGFRHNHCYTSPVYREKVHTINKKLAQEVAAHPGVILWHISNEYGGECYCPLCQDAFRKWLKEKYQTIENLNDRWCTTFWSHTYNSFDQIESPSKIGETQLHALNLDWRRFVTHQTADFIHAEIAAVREGGSDLPTTANLMHYFGSLDYFKIAKEIDVVSWDTYPTWHKEAVIDTTYDNGMCHDLMRSLKGKPFFQMESCPTSTNWQSVSKLKKPGMLFAQSMQAIAHGGEGALYFQIRQSRGASEKFHGAVIDHYGGKDTRVFKEVSEVGAALKAGEKPAKEIADFWDKLLVLFKLVLQMRNSDAKTGDDYIISPVMSESGNFFDSREQEKLGNSAKLPKDADANGAYHIALKGLYLLKAFDKTPEDQLKKVDMKISNADWFRFAQEKEYSK